MKLKVLGAAVAVLVLAVVAVLLIRDGDEAKIRRVFAAVEEDVAKDGEIPMLTLALRIKSVSERVAEPCRFVFEENGQDVSISRNNFGEILAYYLRSMSKFRVSFRDLEISVQGDRADVKGTADFTGSDSVPCIGGPMVRRFQTRMSRANGKWRYTEVLAL